MLQKMIWIFLFLVPLNLQADDLSLSQKLTTTHLSEVNQKAGLDGILALFKDVITQIDQRYAHTRPNDKGLRIQDQKGRALLIRLVQAADFVAEKIDGSSMHMYMVSKLYQKYPKDILLALERSGLSAENKSLFRSLLKSNIEGDR